ncbi:hypothetical protein ACLEPN_30460 [Myxococcus sp. 1LA]
MKRIIFGIVTAVCLLSGVVSHITPEGSAVQSIADKGAQVCEANGFIAYPRDEQGERLPRLEDMPAARSTGLVRQPDGSLRPVTLPQLRATSTVEDVGPAQ